MKLCVEAGLEAAAVRLSCQDFSFPLSGLFFRPGESQTRDTTSVKSSLVCGVQTSPTRHFSSSPSFLSSPSSPLPLRCLFHLHSSSFQADISFSDRCVPSPPQVDLLFIPAALLQRRERRARWNTAHVPTCKRCV